MRSKNQRQALVRPCVFAPRRAPSPLPGARMTLGPALRADRAA